MKFPIELSAIATVLVAFLIEAAACQAEETGLKLGDAVPSFQCLDDQGQTWTLSDHIGQRVVVVYFYSSDFAFCCSRQALAYRGAQSDFGEQGAEVIGISSDTVQAHRIFKEVNKLNFTLLADQDGDIARLFGVPLRAGGKAMVQAESGKAAVNQDGKALKLARNFTAARWTFIIGKDGRIIHRDTTASPVKDAQEVLTILRQRNTK